MGDQGVICTICNSYEHRASSCPKRFRGYSPIAEHGAYLTKTLFQEMYTPSEREPVYTLKDHDTKYPSLRRLYLETSDPTEYQFALKHLGGWDHWQLLVNAEWFQPYLTKWRTELEIKLQSEAIQRIKDEAEADGRNGFAANKFLVQQGWVSRKVEPSRRGRPSKDEIRKIAVQEAFNEKTINEDLQRLELDPIKAN
jgi:hypothetical protein